MMLQKKIWKSCFREKNEEQFTVREIIDEKKKIFKVFKSGSTT